MNTKIGVYVVVLRLSYLLMFIIFYRYIPEGKGSRNQNVRNEHTTILLLKRTDREYKYMYAFNKFVNGVLLVDEFFISTYNGYGSFYVFSTHLSGFLDGSQSRGSCKL